MMSGPKRPRNRADDRAAVTVVIPCYNYGRFLAGCVASVLDQEGVNVRAHIVDDASTDGSGAIAAEFAELDSRIELTAHRTNAGHIATYNEALAQVDTEYVVLISADDLLAPGALRRATRIMDAHPRVGMVYGWAEEFVDAPPPRPRRAYGSSTYAGKRWVDEVFKRGRNPIVSPEVVVRTSVHHRVGYYNPALPHSADLELWLRLAEASDVGHVNGGVQAYHRVHPASMMRTRFGTVLKDMDQRLAAFESFLDSSGRDEPDRVRLRAALHSRVADELRSAIVLIRAGGLSPEEVGPLEDLAGALAPEPGANGRSEGGIGQPLRGFVRSAQLSAQWHRWRNFGY